MLTKRLIACFDVKNGYVTKARRFQDNINIDAAEAVAKKVYLDRIDEIVLYDIMASPERRKPDMEMVKRVAKEIFIPFTVGGGIKSIEDMYEVLKSGAEKISIDSAAVRNPALITEGALAFGSQCIVLSTQVKKTEITRQIPSGYEVYIDGARVATGLDAVEWVKKGESLGAGEVCLNSIDNDGTHEGYDLNITRLVSDAVRIPVIASGGAGRPQHLIDVFQKTDALGAIISSMLYSPRMDRNYSVKEIKHELIKNNVHIRPYEDLLC